MYLDNAIIIYSKIIRMRCDFNVLSQLLKLILTLFFLLIKFDSKEVFSIRFFFNRIEV